jgi:hypothetical protein
MNLITDFWTYCSCYEIPRNYAIWSAIGLMSSLVNRKVYVRQGDIPIHGVTYICLIGEQGNKKTTAMSFARKIFKKVCPEIPCAAAMQSREDIIKFMASEDDRFFFTNTERVQEEYHPYNIFANELKNFLSFNAQGMIEFLTDIFDAPSFDASTIKRGLESFPNPALVLLACETPEWIIRNLKTHILVGGFARRCVFVYETDAKDHDGNLIVIPRPVITDEARAALKRIHEHCHRIKTISGEFTWDPAAERMFDDWYRKNKSNLPEDSVMRGYMRTKDAILLKVAMLYRLASYEGYARLVIDEEILQVTLAILSGIEINMPKLSVAAGRNELAGPQQSALDMLERVGGWMPRKLWELRMDKDLNPAEKLAVISNLQRLEKVVVHRVKVKETEVEAVFLPDVLAEVKRTQKLPPLKL